MSGLANAEDIDIFAYRAGGSGTSASANVLLVIDNGANTNKANSTFFCGIDGAGNVSTTSTTVTSSNQTAFNGKNFAVVQCGLYSVLKSLQGNTSVGTINVGVMMFNVNGIQSYNATTNSFSNDCRIGNASVGGCVVLPFTPFTGTEATRILQWVRCWNSGGANPYGSNPPTGSLGRDCINSFSPTQLNILAGSDLANGAAMQEAWAYYTARSNVQRTGVSGRTYQSNLPASGSCSSNNIIFIGNAYDNNSSPKDSTGASGPKDPLEGRSSVSTRNASPAATTAELQLLSTTVNSSCGIATLPTGNNAENLGAYSINWARYMRNQHNILTYSIGVVGPGCNADYTANLTVMGSEAAGGGGYFGILNFSELQIRLSSIIGNILAVDSVFASASLPVSVSTQGLFLNQVFLGTFRPDADYFPRWAGNLKQFQMGLDRNNNLELQDARGQAAISTAQATGGNFLAACSLSYWSDGVTDNYWANSPRGTCQSTDFTQATDPLATLRASNYPDGDVVEKGGQAHRLRKLNPLDRNAKTCLSTACTPSTPLIEFTVTAGSSGILSGDSRRSLLINWARGTNNQGELQKSTTDMRPSVHGDVIHSRPVVVNHGTDAAPNVVVYYGGNDGFLRAVNGNRTNPVGATAPLAGDEIWSFMPPEFHTRIARLYDNLQTVDYPGSPSTSKAPKDYGMDGPVTAYQAPNNTAIYVYSTMRRGGRMIYAFNVTNRTSPSLLWRIGCPNLTNDTGCSTGFDGIGQTWSAVKPIPLNSANAATNPVAVIFGGGYDNCEDTDSRPSPTTGVNHSCTGTAKGRKIYILNAQSGAVLRAFDTVRPVVADVAVVPDTSGNAKFAYAVDLGGNIYRINLTGLPATWQITRIASLGCDSPTIATYTSTPVAPALAGYSAATSSPCSAQRKFMFAPSVVTPDNGTTYVILLGSGDREKPVDFYQTTHKDVINRFFQVKDQPETAGWLTGADVCDAGPLAGGVGAGAANSATKAICARDSLYGIPSGTVNPTQSALATRPKGWYFDLIKDDSGSEQVVTSALTLFSVTTFSTNKPVPSTSSCTASLGQTRLYSIGYSDASPASTGAASRSEIAGVGLPPSPVGGKVLLNSFGGQTTGAEPASAAVPFCIGCSTASALAVAAPKQITVGNRPKSRLFWYLEK